MSEVSCAGARERLPSYAVGRMAPAETEAVGTHLETCAECAAELALIEALIESRPGAPSGLADRVTAAIAAPKPRRSQAGWGLSAAAVAALALGIGITSGPDPSVDPSVPGYAVEVDEEALWSSEDGLVAGAPLLDDLSDEALEQLLDELVSGSAGGSA